MTHIHDLLNRAYGLQTEIDIGLRSAECTLTEELNHELREHELHERPLHIDSGRLHTASLKVGGVLLGEEVYYRTTSGNVTGFSFQTREDIGSNVLGAIIRPLCGTTSLWVPVEGTKIDDIDELVWEDDFMRALSEEFVQDELDLKKIHHMLSMRHMDSETSAKISSVLQYFASPVDFFEAVYPYYHIRYIDENDYQIMQCDGSVRFPLMSDSHFLLAGVVGTTYLAIRTLFSHTSILGTALNIIDGRTGVDITIR